MPDFSAASSEQAHRDPPALHGDARPELTQNVLLPVSGWEAGMRGAIGKCPRCGEAKLFWRFLKPVANCPHCRQDWTLQRADDFPAYVSIFVTGHLLAPLIIMLISEYEIPAGILAAIILPLAALMMLAFLQPAKGAIIAFQWWLGLHGFQRERADSGNPPRKR